LICPAAVGNSEEAAEAMRRLRQSAGAAIRVKAAKQLLIRS
jgi:hypothetical protein